MKISLPVVKVGIDFDLLTHLLSRINLSKVLRLVAAFMPHFRIFPYSSRFRSVSEHSRCCLGSYYHFGTCVTLERTLISDPAYWRSRLLLVLERRKIGVRGTFNDHIEGYFLVE